MKTMEDTTTAVTEMSTSRCAAYTSVPRLTVVSKRYSRRGARTPRTPSAACRKDGLVLQKLDALPVVVVKPVVARASDVGLDQVRLGAVVDGHPDHVVHEHLHGFDVVRQRVIDRLVIRGVGDGVHVWPVV